MNKTFKKVLSVVLSLAMVLTSITVFDTTAKAEGEVTFTVTAAASSTSQINANWSHPDVEYTSQGCYVNEVGNVVLDANHYAKAANGHVWSAQNDIKTALDTVVGSQDNSVVTSKGGTFVITVVYYDAEGNAVAIGTSNEVEIAEYVNTDLSLNCDRYENDGATTVISWKPISNVAKYVVYNKDDGTTLATVNNAGSTWTNFATPVGTAAGQTYTCQVKAYDSNGTEIEITNNEITVNKYYVAVTDPDEPEVAPDEHTKADFSSETWNVLDKESGVENTYYVSTTNKPAAGPWGKIYAPHSNAAYHNERTNCILGDASAYVFQQSNVAKVWINGEVYANPSTAFNCQGDCSEISCDYLNNGINVVTLVLKDGTNKTFGIKVSAPLTPDATEPATQDTIDPDTVAAWTQLAGPSDKGSVVYVNEDVAMGNAGLRGFYAAGASTNWNISDNMKAVPVFGFVTSGGNATSIIINGTEYINAKDTNNTLVYIGSDCVYINQSLLEAEAGTTAYYTITAVGSGTGTFILKVVGPEKEAEETAPDQTLGTVTDWVKVEGGQAKAVDGSSYYVSEAYRNAHIPYNDLLGLYDDHTNAAYHPAGCTVTGSAFVFAIKDSIGEATVNASALKSVWIDGTKYESGTANCYLDGDQIHLSQSLFALPENTEEKVFAVTVRTADKDYTFGVKVAATVYYDVTVDGAAATSVAEGDTYTLPTTAAYGYACGDALYKPGAEVTVNGDMSFTSINTVTAEIADGAVVTKTGDYGIAFQASVTVNGGTDLLSASYVKEGMLISTKDIYTEIFGSQLTLAQTQLTVGSVKNIANDGTWFGGTAGTYRAGVTKVDSANIIRDFIATSYVQLSYVDGTTKEVYAAAPVIRSIKQVAQRAQAAGETFENLAAYLAAE